MALLTAALLGVIQGLTEFLPVSSTAHLLLGGRLLGFSDPGGLFTVTIQFGSILAVIWLYRRKLWRLATEFPSNPDARRFAVMVGAAFVPAVMAGLTFGGFVKAVLYDSPRVIAVAFIVGGLVMLALERWRPAPVVSDADRTPVARAVGIGVCQTLALVPGVSRSGATIIGGMAMGLDRAAAAEFSFFLAIPTLGAAFVHDLWQARHLIGGGLGLEIAVGIVAAFLASALVIRPFVRFVGRAGFAPFAWYRIGLGALILLSGARG